jgi:hypothetical protein
MKVDYVVIQSREKLNQSKGSPWIIDLICITSSVAGDIDDRAGNLLMPEESADRHQVALDSAMRRRIRT